MSLDDNEQVHFTFEADSEKTFSWCRTYCSWELITWNEKGWSYTYVNTFLTSFKLDSGPSLKGRYLPLQLSPAILSCLAIELFRGSYSPCLISRGGGGDVTCERVLLLSSVPSFCLPFPREARSAPLVISGTKCKLLMQAFEHSVLCCLLKKWFYRC